MSEFSTIAAAPRAPRGKGGARALRREGRLPAIVYGGDGEPVPISLDHATLGRETEQAGFFTRLYDLEIDGKTIRVLPRDVQVDPVTDRPIHVDFVRYVKGAKLAISVAVRFENQEECEGLKRGGVLNVVRHEVELLCPFEAIPEFISADISELQIGDSVHISAVPLPEGVTPTITDRDFTIATIAAPTVIVEPEEEEAEEEEDAEAAEGEEAADDESESAAQGQDSDT